MDNIVKFFMSKEFFSLIGFVLIGFLIYFSLKGIIKRSKSRSKRQETIKRLILGIIKYVLIIFIGLACLSTLGFNVTSFLAGLGIAGVVVGLALQDIMKDILSGIVIITEDQFDIGDLIEINGFVGEVISLGVKTTKIKDYTGKVKIVSNRNITEVINYSKANNMAIVDIPLSYEEDINNINKVLDKIIKEIDKELKVKNPTQILGINNFADSAIVYRIMAEVSSGTAAVAQRQIRQIIKEELDKENITIPYNKLEVINGK